MCATTNPSLSVAGVLRRSLPARHSTRVRHFTLVSRCLLAGLLVTGSLTIAAADTALDEYNLAVQLYRQDRWALAGESFQKFLKDNPRHEKAAVARMYLGLTEIKQADYNAAREEFRLFVKDFPRNQNVPQARYRIAECSYLLNDLPAARAELETYLKEHPEDELGERAWPYLGDVQLRLNNPPAAAAAFAEAVKRYPKGALLDDAQFGWAKALEAANQPEAALQKYQDLAKGDGPRAAEALFQIASREFDSGHFPQSATLYQDLARRFPKSPLVADAHLNAGFALFRQGEFEQASAQFEQAAREPARQVQADYWRALCLKSQSKFEAAITLLKSLSEKAANDPQAEAILFQTGMCERLAGQSATAQQTLMSVVTRFPESDSADDALHFATELALDAGELPVVQQRLELFAKNYGRSGLRLYQELLAGRYELALAGQLTAESAPAEDIATRYQAAMGRFNKVLTGSSLARTRNQARYYLALAQQLQNENDAALTTIQPLVTEVQTDAGAAEFADALILQTDSLLKLQRFAEATTAATSYLDRFPQGGQRARALSLQAISTAQQEQLEASLKSWQTLVQEFPTAEVTSTTTLILGELADRRSDWPTAETLYSQLVKADTGKATDTAKAIAVPALRGLAWAEFQQRKFPAAARDFKTLITEYPEHRLAPEARYYYAESLREQGQLATAAEAFSEAFRQLSPLTPAAAGAEQQSPLLFAYRAGLQAARTRRQAKEIDAADAAYAAVLEKFPKPQHLDKLLDEWALLNYESERYEQADEIFRRLVKETPDSDLADNARLSLAESDLLSNRLAEAKAMFDELRLSEKSDATVRERATFQLIVIALEQRQWEDVTKLGQDFITAFPQSGSLPYVKYALAEATLANPKATTEQLENLLTNIAALIPQLPADSAEWAPRLWVLAAEAQFRLKRYDDIAATVADFTQKQAENPLTYQVEEVLGRALKQQARFDEARATLERVVDDEAAFRTETAAKSQFLIAETWFLQEKWKEALLAYQKVYASYAYPEWQSAALLQSGKCDEQMGNLKDAIASYDRMISEFPKSTHLEEARMRLMQAKLKTGTTP